MLKEPALNVYPSSISLPCLSIWINSKPIRLEIDLFQSKKIYNKEILVLPGVNLSDIFYLCGKFHTPLQMRRVWVVFCIQNLG